MTTVDYAQLYQKAIAESGVGADVLPDGNYNVRIGSVKGGQSKGGRKPQVGIRLVALDGPHADKSTWVNQTFTGDNPTAVAIFLKIMAQFGVPPEAIAAGVPPEKLAEYIVVGTTGVAELSHHIWDNTPRQDLKSFAITGTTTAAIAPAQTAAEMVPSYPAPVPVAAAFQQPAFVQQPAAAGQAPAPVQIPPQPPVAVPVPQPPVEAVPVPQPVPVPVIPQQPVQEPVAIPINPNPGF